MLPGSPGALEAAADDLGRAADDLVEVRDRATANARGLHSAWEGMAELRATVQIERQAGTVLDVADAARGAGPVLRTYAAVLRAAQQQFADGRAEAARGHARIDAVGSAASPAAEAVRVQGGQEIDAGEAAMAAAVERVRVANEVAASQIDRLAGDLARMLPEHPPPPPPPDEPGLLSTIGHGLLDLGGLVPGAGEPLDLANAAWYEAEGNHLDAGISAAGAIPFAGWFATGGKAIRYGVKGAEGGTDAARTVGKADSRVLGRNLEAAGTPRPPGTHAHHIVAGNSPDARDAREALERLDIDINDPANGVFLPGNAKSPNPTGASVHAPLHTKDYFVEVNQTLGSARNREQALDALDYLRSEDEADVKIFRIDPTEDAEWLLARGYDANIALRDAAGHPQGEKWEPVGVDLLSTSEDGRALSRSDAPWIGLHMIGLRLEVADRVERLLGTQGELLELRCADAPVAAYNVTTIVDALDRDRSELVWFRSGRLMKIKDYVFRPGVIPEATAFRLPEYLETVLLTETIADALTGLGLAGFDVREIGETVPA